MRHPALTRFLSVVLTITCIIMLFASLSGLRKAEKLRLEDEKVFSKLQQRITVYEQLSASLEGVKDYKQANEELEKEEQQHEKDSSQHRSDVAMHTAEEGGYQAGADALWEAKAKLAEQRAGYEQAKREYKRQEAQFNQQKAAVEGIKTLAEACAAAAALPPVPHPGTAPTEPACPAAPVEPVIPDDPGQFTLTAPAPEQYESEEAYQAALLEYNNALMAYTAKKNAYDQAVAAAESYPARLLAYQQAMEEYNNVTLPAYKEEKAKYDAKAKAYETYTSTVNGLLAQGSAILGGMGLPVPSDLASMSGALMGAYEISAAAVSEGEKMLEAAKTAMDQAGKALENGENQAQGNLENVWWHMGQLEDEAGELSDEKDRLEERARQLAEQRRLLEQQKADENKLSSTKILLMQYDGIASRVDSGEDLLGSSRAYAGELETENQRMHRGRIALYAIALVGSLCGVFTVPAAFEKLKSRWFLLFPAVILLGCAAMAVYICYALGFDPFYASIPALIFAPLYLIFAFPRNKLIVDGESE